MDETRHNQALILNRSDYRESDSLITAYTRDFGKLTLLARGTKKIKSKLTGHLEPISLADILIIKGRGFDYVGSALAQEMFLNLKSNLNKIYFAGRALSCFNRLVKEAQKDENLFFLLYRWLEVLNNYPDESFSKESGELFFSYFAFKLMTELGYKPELYQCLSCRQKIKPGKNYFNLKNGGVVCAECLIKENINPGSLANELLTISDNCIKLLRFIIDNQLDTAQKLKLDKKIIKELSVLTTNFLNFHS